MSSVRASRSRWYCGGFSLVELTLAIAIIVFAVLPMVALLPLGANSYGNASLHERAVQLVGQITTCMQLASASGSGASFQYTALTPFATGPQQIAWTQSVNSSSFGPYYFDSAGNLTTSGSGTAVFVAVVAIAAPTAPSTSDPAAAMNPRTAMISVAWPATASFGWNGVVPQFTNIQGHEEATLALSPIFQ